MKYLLVIAALTPLSLQAADSVDAQIGLSLGTPGAVNLVIKNEVFGQPMQLAVGYVGTAYGAEAGYSFYYNSESAMRSWQITVGTFRAKEEKRVVVRDASGTRWWYEDETWSYLGVSGTFQYGGFFLEPGISAGTGDFSNPQLTLQAGWLWSL